MDGISPELSRALARMFPPEARWAYFQKRNGPMFVYNTERIHERYPTAAEGKFESAVFMPVGKGSRSGKATRFEVLEASRSLHELRRDAKARALRLYEEWEQTGKVVV